MNIDISRQDAELIIRRFNEAEQKDLEEQALVRRLRASFPENDRHPLRAYLHDFKKEPTLPPAPNE